jgi:hypothetical protein
MKTSNDNTCCDKTKPATEVRMGREVPIVKKASSGDSEKTAKCAAKDEQEKNSMNRASSRV